MTSTVPESLRPSPNATGQPAPVLSAWVDEQLRETLETVVQRLAALRDKLQSNAFMWDNAQLARSIEGWRDESERLHFEPLLRTNVVDLLLGRGMNARNALVQQYQKVLSAANATRQQFDDLARNYRVHASNARRLLVEMDFERQELERCISQALEWLGEMTTDVQRRTQASEMDGDQASVLMQRAESHAAQIKRLHSLSEQARVIILLGQAVLERRNALLAQVKVDFEGYERVWLRHTHPVAVDARGRGGIKGVDKALMAHDELTKRLGRTQDACQALQQEEQTLGHHLLMMREELGTLPR